MPITQFEPNRGQFSDLEVPAPGFPPSEVPLRAWFRQRHGRDATELEIGALMQAMAEREAPPRPEDPHPEPGGWRVEPPLNDTSPAPHGRGRGAERRG
jgi:hypothetical protein